MDTRSPLKTWLPILPDLPEFPSNYCPSFQKANPQTTDDKIQLTLNYMKCTKNYTFDQFYQDLSNTTIPREPGLKYEYSTFGSALLGRILTLKSNMSSGRGIVVLCNTDRTDVDISNLGLNQKVTLSSLIWNLLSE
jgi:hypothetical protein